MLVPGLNSENNILSTCSLVYIAHNKVVSRGLTLVNPALSPCIELQQVKGNNYTNLFQ